MLVFKKNISVDEVFNELERLDVYKSNEEFISNDSYESICDVMSESLGLEQLLDEFDNLVNPFMNKNIIIANIEDLSDFEISFDNEWVKIYDKKNMMKVSFKRKDNTLKYKCTYYTSEGKEQVKISHIIKEDSTMIDMKIKGNGIELKNTVFLNICYEVNKIAVMNLIPYLEQTVEYLKNNFLPRIAANAEDNIKLNLKK